MKNIDNHYDFDAVACLAYQLNDSDLLPLLSLIKAQIIIILHIIIGHSYQADLTFRE